MTNNSSSTQVKRQKRKVSGGLLSSGTWLMSWIVLGGSILLSVLNQLRESLGYEPFDSQWGLIGLFSLFGIIVVFFLALALFILCPIAYVIARKQNNLQDARRALLALAITLSGFLIFIFF